MRYGSLLAASAIVAFAMAAQASTITYSTQSAFTAATTGVTTYAIPAPSSGTSQSVPSPYTTGPLTFNNGTNPLFLVDDGVYGPGQTYLDAFHVDELMISLTGATALAFDISSFASQPYVFTVEANGAFAGTFPTPGGPVPVFFGITSDTPITSLSFTPNFFAEFNEVDTLQFEVGSNAPVTVTPEPSTIALLGTGLLSMAGAAKRKFLRA
jgi:PEP-CTERM motif